MVVKVEGKVHRKGVNKAGKNYDFVRIYFLAPDRDVEGLAAVDKIIETSVIEYDNILVGQHYDIVPDFDGNIIEMRPAKV